MVLACWASCNKKTVARQVIPRALGYRTALLSCPELVTHTYTVFMPETIISCLLDHEGHKNSILNLHIFSCIPHLLWVYHKLIMWPALSWLDSSVGRALHQYHRGHRFESRSGLNFFQALISQL